MIGWHPLRGVYGVVGWWSGHPLAGFEMMLGARGPCCCAAARRIPHCRGRSLGHRHHHRYEFQTHTYHLIRLCQPLHFQHRDHCFGSRLSSPIQQNRPNYHHHYVHLAVAVIGDEGRLGHRLSVDGDEEGDWRVGRAHNRLRLIAHHLHHNHPHLSSPRVVEVVVEQ